jgi:Ala-tRNA(Pro) deacylase
MSGSVTLKQRATAPAELTVQYLEHHGVAYKLFEHEERFSAAGEALATGIKPQNAAKGILLRDHDGYRLAVIPASERLDLKKLHDLLEPSSELRFASEQEMDADFPDFEVGALPPIGFLVGLPEVLDGRLFDHRRVLCNAGDHRHSMLVDPRDIADLGDARIGDICEC